LGKSKLPFKLKGNRIGKGAIQVLFFVCLWLAPVSIRKAGIWRGNWGVVLDWELVLNQWPDEYDASIHNDGF
jgi:hypothetical protein